jgi:hypothetical protein
MEHFRVRSRTVMGPVGDELVRKLGRQTFDPTVLSVNGRLGQTVGHPHLIKREMDLYDPQFISDLATKLHQPEYADALQLWVLVNLAAKKKTHRPDGK